jgi:NAD(P)H-hydrate repair Nnr-like enzyme with NAD(P)H-hydrate dehydratase domain
VALATAGSGDVLTGMITSMLAQGYKRMLQLCVYLHGLTADIAIPETGTQSLSLRILFRISESLCNLREAH